MESESHSPSSVSEDFKSEIISLVDDSEMEGVSKGSTSDGSLFGNTLEALFLEKPDRGESSV